MYPFQNALVLPQEVHGHRGRNQGETYLGGGLAKMLQNGAKSLASRFIISGSQDIWTLGKCMQVPHVLKSGHHMVSVRTHTLGIFWQ